MVSIVESVEYEAVPISPVHCGLTNPRIATLYAFRALRDSKLYQHQKIGKKDILSGQGYNIRFEGFDKGTLFIDEFAGDLDNSRYEVEILLRRFAGLTLDTHPDSLIEYGKPYNSWIPEILEIEE